VKNFASFQVQIQQHHLELKEKKKQNKHLNFLFQIGNKPAFAAIAGPRITPFFLKHCIASGGVGKLAPRSNIFLKKQIFEVYNN